VYCRAAGVTSQVRTSVRRLKSETYRDAETPSAQYAEFLNAVDADGRDTLALYTLSFGFSITRGLRHVTLELTLSASRDREA
jgi:hypothetical protein